MMLCTWKNVMICKCMSHIRGQWDRVYGVCKVATRRVGQASTSMLPVLAQSPQLRLRGQIGADDVLCEYRL